MVTGLTLWELKILLKSTGESVLIGFFTSDGLDRETDAIFANRERIKEFFPFARKNAAVGFFFKSLSFNSENERLS